MMTSTLPQSEYKLTTNLIWNYLILNKIRCSYFVNNIFLLKVQLEQLWCPHHKVFVDGISLFASYNNSEPKRKRIIICQGKFLFNIFYLLMMASVNFALKISDDFLYWLFRLNKFVSKIPYLTIFLSIEI